MLPMINILIYMDLFKEEIIMSGITNTDVFTKLEKVSKENKKIKDKRYKLNLYYKIKTIRWKSFVMQCQKVEKNRINYRIGGGKCKNIQIKVV